MLLTTRFPRLAKRLRIVNRNYATALRVYKGVIGKLPLVKEVSMPDPNYKALCAELLGELQALRRAVADEMGCSSPEPSFIARARAALDQPEPVAVVPTESDVTELFYRHMGEGSEVGFENAIAEALDRWGTPANTLEQPNDN
jgi:hypothetical protein